MKYLIPLLGLALLASSCASTAPVTRSAMGIQPVESSQLILSSVREENNVVYVSGRLFSPLNTVSKTNVTQFGRDARITMNQAMLRTDGSQRFSFAIPLKPKTERVVIGKDKKVIWTRSGGARIDTADTEAQATRAAEDLEKRINRVIRAVD